jgi:carbonic anhydrase/acetyltransferase-like protein (isoleucine patch superfamily)
VGDVPGIAGDWWIEAGPFGRYRFSQDDRPGFAERGDHGGVAIGDVALAEGRAAAGGPAGDVDDVFDADGNAMEGAGPVVVFLELAEALGFLAGMSRVDENPGVDFGFELVDAGEAVLDEVDRAKDVVSEVARRLGDGGKFGDHAVRVVDVMNVRHQPELVDRTAFIAPRAVVIGEVTIGAESSVWFGAVVRGDTEAIRIGKQTNIQDGCVLHADAEFPCTLGDRVTLGHGAIVHGASVEDDCLIGMRAVVMNGAKIGRGSIVAAGSIVTEGTEIPPGSVVMGQPGKVRRETTERDRERIRHAAEHYVAAGRVYLSSVFNVAGPQSED